ncbi:O-antigen/teichoic acid export membrane protein [Virgibacillus halotolerans]|uniref:lipopolysaccharide biosynthesis protein n=1 Tax=Virgibacillus halotolerans TaxID=1071053 RepID=UPI0019617788|nr:oligosaccharide flippase family protein [Virgibacillus halotolerans]MBM7599930.1 O-antigen/teichoic acid export membrane protein [Virgibacillus halotolerans]
MSEKFNGIKIKSKLTWSLGGNIVYALSQWLIITIIAKFGSAEDLGIYSLGLALTAPIVLFFSFQLRTILATDSKDEFTFSQYYGGRILHLTLSYVVIIPIAIIYSNDSVTRSIILLMGLVKYVESLSDICMGYFQKQSRIDLIGKSQLYRGILTVIIVGFIYIYTQNIILSISGLLIVMVLRLVLYDIKHLKPFTKVSPVFGRSSLKLMKMGLPLGLTALIGSLNTNIPRYFLDYYSSIEEVGIYSALYYVLIASNMLITPISLLAAPRIANAYNQKGRKAFTNVNIQFLTFAIIAFLIIFIPIIFQSELILTIIYGEDYASYTNSFIIISFSLLFGFLSAFLNLSVISARLIRIQPFINLIATVITLITGYYLISLYGIYGAAWSLLISRFIQFFLYLVLLLYIIRRKGLENSF